MSDESTERIAVPVVEEEIVAGTQTVNKGSVRVRTEVERTVRTVEIPAARYFVEVFRVPVEREVAEIPEIRQEGDDVIVPVVEEEVVVTKRLVLKEEIHLVRRRVDENLSREVTLDRQNAIIERLNSKGDVIA